MNKFYLIVPAVLLGLFLVFERDFEKKRKQEQDIRAVEAAAKKQADDLARAKREEASAADAKKRLDDRERQDRERAAKKQRDYETMMAELERQTDQQVAETEKLTSEIAALSKQLTELSSKKEETALAAFNLAKQVESQRVDRRTTEIETQRMTTMIAARLTDSAWTTPSPDAVPRKSN